MPWHEAWTQNTPIDVDCKERRKCIKAVNVSFVYRHIKSKMYRYFACATKYLNCVPCFASPQLVCVGVQLENAITISIGKYFVRKQQENAMAARKAEPYEHTIVVNHVRFSYD